MNKEEAEQRAQEHLNFYGSGAYKDYEEITMPDGRPGIRVSGFVPSIKDMTMSTQERDTHFQGAAKVLMQKVNEKNRAKAHSTGHYLDEEELHLLIARLIYDFMGATVRYESTCIDIELYSGEAITLEECIRRIPDMAE